MSTPNLTPEEREFIEKYQNDVARWAVGKVATNVFGETIATALSGPIFDLIGIGATDTAEKYHREVMDELHKIEGQIAAMQQAINDVKNAITIVGTLISAEALASRLQELEFQANVVRTHYGLMSNDIAALAGSQGAAAAVDLFGRLRQPNDATVAVAMSNINSILLTTSAANPGVLARLQTYLCDQLTTWAATPANYTNRPWADGTPDGVRVYMGTPVLTGTKLHNGGLDAARKVLPVICELFRRVLAVQVQGLVYLGAAWRNGPQQPALVQQIQMVVAQIGLMQGFYAAASTLVNQTAINNLRTYMPRVRSKLQLRPVYTSRDGSFPCPFDEAWIVWDELIEQTFFGESNSQFSAVRNTWDDQIQPLTWRLYRNGSCPNWTWVTDCGAPYYKLPKFEDKPLPAEFDVLKGLPVKIPTSKLRLGGENPEWDPHALLRGSANEPI
jgi:DNA-binding FrmR family transcriptional regulator